MNVAGKTALVTGATGGIGQAIARTLAKAGASLVVTGRRVEVLEPLADELGARTLGIDLAERAEVERLLEEAGDADILVANAALPASGFLHTFTGDEIDRALEVNLRAPIAMAHAMAPRMVERGAGHIVFISSLAGKTASPGSSIYNATKFGLRGFSTALRAELIDKGVGVSCVFPGFIRDAGMFADSGASLPTGVGTRTPDQVAAGVLRAIERNKGEVDVAPVTLRMGAVLGALSPGLSVAVQRRAGGDRLTRDIASGQTDKRS